MSFALRRDTVRFKEGLALALLRAPDPVGPTPFPLEHPRAAHTYSGSAALYRAVAALDLRKGDRVLIPDFNCGHEFEPFRRLGLVARFYRVDRGLRVDVADLEARLDEGARALLVTHYFGFPQPLEEIAAVCAARGVAVIEDCAHALYSADASGPLGRTGAVSIFSPRKSLPLPHGGVLVANAPGVKLPISMPQPPGIGTAIKLVELATKAGGLQRAGLPIVVAVRLLRRAGASRWISWWDPDSERLDFDSRVLTWAMAPEVLRLARRVDARDVSARRRENFAFLRDALDGTAGLTPAFDDLAPGVCPLAFPVLVEDPQRLAQKLRRDGVSACVWWEKFHPAVDWSAHADAAYLKRHLMVLPVHQDLTPRQLERAAAVVTRASVGRARSGGSRRA